MNINVFLATLLTVGVLNALPIAAEETSHSNAVAIYAGSGISEKPDRPHLPSHPSGTRRSISLGNPFGIEAIGTQVWITTVDDHCIYQGNSVVDRLTRIAGNGSAGYSGDGGPATTAQFNWPHEVRCDASGNLFVADTRNHAIRRIDAASGLISTIAGNGTEGFAGDGQSGESARFRQPHSVALDGDGGLLVADTVNHRLRRIDLQTLIVETVCGNGEKRLPTDGAVAKESPLFGPRSLAVDETSIWIALREGNSIWRIDRTTGTIHHEAGTGEQGYTGDGGPPQKATFNGPKGLTIDDRQRLLVVDTENHALRRIDRKQQIVETILGGTAAKKTFTLKRPHGIGFTTQLGYLIADSENHRVLVGK